ncbi:P-loop containing nucleoside triphosphate hydrolase protein [Halenospora varia]|nr:P-loop containing nucleoside triphosphate hydrolase protein [Halenospora varia]
MTESENNARAKAISRMPPPSLKHKLTGSYNEPEAKQRKTLAERAGESRSIATATPGPRPVMRGTTLVGAGRSLVSTASSFSSMRNPSFSSSISSRTPSVSSRNTSNGSFSSSIGPGHGRSASANVGRPQSSIFSQSTNSRPTSTLPKARPATASEQYSEEDDGSGGKRKGMQDLALVPYPLPSSPDSSTIQSEKLRMRHSTASLRSMNSNRDVSVSTAMSRLSIDDREPSQRGRRQADSTEMKLPSKPTLAHKASFSSSFRRSRNQTSENMLVLYQTPSGDSVAPQTPSRIPRSKSLAVLRTPSKSSKSSQNKSLILTRDSNNDSLTAWDVRGRLEDMEAMYFDLKDKMDGTSMERNGLEEAVTVYKARIAELENIRSQLSSSNQTLQSDLDAMREKSNMFQQKLLTTTNNLDDQVRAHRLEIDDNTRNNRNELDKIRRDHTDEVDRLIRLHRDELREVERRGALELDDQLRDLEKRNNAKLDEERTRRLREVSDLESQLSKEHSNLNSSLEKKDQDIQHMRSELESLRGDVEREQSLKVTAQSNLTELKETMQKTGLETSSTIQSLESTVASLRARIHFLESGSKAQSDSFAEMEARLQEAVKSAEVSKQKLIKEETLRRILFNQVQELKGNIRVMCRVRPVPKAGGEGEVAQLKYPDIDKESKELEILGKEEKSSLGTVTRKSHAFTFDRVFGPEAQNQEVFEEISQLVQSALDGYNVCIFCYGQTGSGKTHTMSSTDGMIPRATHQIYETATNLKEKGWTYTMEGSFIEVYNEEIHDLLGNSKDLDKKKHEIRHDDARKQTTVTGLKSVPLDSPDTVETMLKQAASNRSVAATKSNERSSRSHSVFILKLVGRNSTTNETSEGTLNLVDLAGSERLKQSGAEGDRKKETQNINKSLSCLGDVIGALGQGKEGGHVPYRNSKLTYLLQYSLGGNSKTLMFVMASPLEAHLTETLTSLKFATKVHNTHIGTAKKSTKVRE